MTLDDVKDIETLRKAAKMLESENLQMAKMIARLKRELFELRHGKPEQLKLELQIAELEEQLARRNKLLFGDKSEKSRRDKKVSKNEVKQTGHGRREQPELEVVEEVHLANVEEDTCELCGGHLEASEGFFEESEEVDIIERRFVVKKAPSPEVQMWLRELYQDGAGSFEAHQWSPLLGRLCGACRHRQIRRSFTS